MLILGISHGCLIDGAILTGRILLECGEVKGWGSFHHLVGLPCFDVVGTKIPLGHEMVGADLILGDRFNVEVIVSDGTSFHKPVCDTGGGRPLHFCLLWHLALGVNANGVKSIERRCSCFLGGRCNILLK